LPLQSQAGEPGASSWLSHRAVRQPGEEGIHRRCLRLAVITAAKQRLVEQARAAAEAERQRRAEAEAERQRQGKKRRGK
jgi:hypothetical protein